MKLSKYASQAAYQYTPSLRLMSFLENFRVRKGFFETNKILVCLHSAAYQCGWLSLLMTLPETPKWGYVFTNNPPNLRKLPIFHKFHWFLWYCTFNWCFIAPNTMISWKIPSEIGEIAIFSSHTTHWERQPCFTGFLSISSKLHSSFVLNTSL